MTRSLHAILALVVAASALVIPTAEGAEVVLCLERDGAVKVEQVWDSGACTGCEGEAPSNLGHQGLSPAQQIGACDACIDIRISGGVQIGLAPTRTSLMFQAPAILLAPVVHTASESVAAGTAAPPSIATSPPSIAQLSIWRC